MTRIPDIPGVNCRIRFWGLYNVSVDMFSEDEMRAAEKEYREIETAIRSLRWNAPDQGITSDLTAAIIKIRPTDKQTAGMFITALRHKNPNMRADSAKILVGHFSPAQHRLELLVGILPASGLS